MTLFTDLKKMANGTKEIEIPVLRKLLSGDWGVNKKGNENWFYQEVRVATKIVREHRLVDLTPELDFLLFSAFPFARKLLPERSPTVFCINDEGKLLSKSAIFSRLSVRTDREADKKIGLVFSAGDAEEMDLNGRISLHNVVLWQALVSEISKDAYWSEILLKDILVRINERLQTSLQVSLPRLDGLLKVAAKCAKSCPEVAKHLLEEVDSCRLTMALSKYLLDSKDFEWLAAFLATKVQHNDIFIARQASKLLVRFNLLRNRESRRTRQ